MCEAHKPSIRNKSFRFLSSLLNKYNGTDGHSDKTRQGVPCQEQSNTSVMAGKQQYITCCCRNGNHLMNINVLPS